MSNELFNELLNETPNERHVHDAHRVSPRSGTVGRCSNRGRLLGGLALALMLASATGLSAQVCGDCAHDDLGVTVVDALVAAQVAADLVADGPGILDCDVNRDDAVTVLDALAIAQFSAGIPTSLDCFECGDCNGDGNPLVTSADVVTALTLSLTSTAVGESSSFAACDADGDGVISRRDVFELLARVGQLLDTVPCAGCGDCNLDFQVTVADQLRTLIAPPLFPGTRAHEACDIDSDGSVGPLDTLAIASFLTGATNSLSCANGISPMPGLASPSGFCVLGNGLGTPWSAEITDTATGASEVVTSPGVVGPASVVAAEWIRIVNLSTQFNASASVLGGCFIILDNGAPPQGLATAQVEIQPGGCTVPGPTATCSFNPELMAAQLEADASAVPVARPDYGVTEEGVTLTLDVLINDLDQDGNLMPNSLAVIAQPTFGMLAVTDDNRLAFVPATGFAGAVSGAYEVCDEDGLCSVAGVHIAVLPGPENAPNAVDDEATTFAGSVVKIKVLDNDSDLDDNLDPDSLMIEIEPEQGQAFVTGEGIVKYVPNANAAGTDELIYQVCDTSGLCDGAAVVIEVLNED